MKKIKNDVKEAMLPLFLLLVILNVFLFQFVPKTTLLIIDAVAVAGVISLLVVASFQKRNSEMEDNETVAKEQELPKNMKYCPDCENVISKNAEVCPNCGKRLKHSSRRSGVGFLGVFLAIVLGGMVLWYVVSPYDTPVWMQRIGGPIKALILGEDHYTIFNWDKLKDSKR